MSNTSTPVTEVVSDFISLCIASIKGDDAKATSIKIQKRARAALRSQISIKEATTLELEDSMEEAGEASAAALINNGQKIANNDQYLRNLIAADAKLKATKESLKKHVEVIDFLKAQLALVSK